MTEVVAAVDGSHSTVSFEEAPMLATALTEAVSDGCGGEAALSGSAYLVLGSALHRLGQRASNAAAGMGTGMGTWTSQKMRARTHIHLRTTGVGAGIGMWAKLPVKAFGVGSVWIARQMNQQYQSKKRDQSATAASLF